MQGFAAENVEKRKRDLFERFKLYLRPPPTLRERERAGGGGGGRGMKERDRKREGDGERVCVFVYFGGSKVLCSLLIFPTKPLSVDLLGGIFWLVVVVLNEGMIL